MGAVVGLVSFTDTDRTMLLIFSRARLSVSDQLDNHRALGLGRPTNVENIATATCVEVKGRVTCWAILRLKLSNEFVEACLM